MLFSRRGKDRHQDRHQDRHRATSEFWQWWSSARGRTEKSISGGGWDDALLGEITAKVKAIHPGLQWEFAKGTSSQHLLVVCSGGDQALRATAERWRAAAPAPDAIWAYHSTRQPDPGALDHNLTIDGHELALAELRFGVHLDVERREVDVTTFHPAFASMSESERVKITFLSLDWALGQAAVELWVGAVDSSTTPPQRPQTVRGLRAAVAELEDKRSEDSWSVLGGHDGRGVPMTASIQTPLKPARWPRFDTHVAVVLPYRSRLDNGFPDDDSLSALRAFEDDIIGRVRHDGALVAHETCNGRRTLHVFVDGATQAQSAVRDVLPEWREGKASVRSTLDASWQGISHLRP